MALKRGTGRIFRILAVAVIVTSIPSCDDPLSEEDKKTLVRTLVDGRIDAGHYSLFWDGKDESGETVAPGVYLCRFYARTYGDEHEMTALEGGSDKLIDSNDSTVIAAPPHPYHYALEKISPDPFRVKEGTNVVFTMPERAALLLTIHRKE